MHHLRMIVDRFEQIGPERTAAALVVICLGALAILVLAEIIKADLETRRLADMPPTKRDEIDEAEIFLRSMLDKTSAMKRQTNAIFFALDGRSFPDESVDVLAGDAARIVSGAGDELKRAVFSLEHAIRLLAKRRKVDP